MIEPKTLQAISERRMERKSEQLRERQKRIIQQGLFLMQRQKPRERLQGYMAQTYVFDMPKLLDATYADRRKRGEAEPLYAELVREQWAQQLQLRQQALEMGADPAHIPQEPEPLMFWPKLLDLAFGVDVLEDFARDFRKLYWQEHDKGSVVLGRERGGY